VLEKHIDVEMKDVQDLFLSKDSTSMKDIDTPVDMTTIPVKL